MRTTRFSGSWGICPTLPPDVNPPSVCNLPQLDADAPWMRTPLDVDPSLGEDHTQTY